jgi:hypothetical protein
MAPKKGRVNEEILDANDGEYYSKARSHFVWSDSLLEYKV